LALELSGQSVQRAICYVIRAWWFAHAFIQFYDYLFWPMAKALTKSQIVATVAEKVGITKKQAAQTHDVAADLAYKNAKNTFTVPGLGKLALVNRTARTMIMAFGPKKGQTIKIDAKRVVKFRAAKAAKDAILGSK
jgi:DNA-binding protein HU-beta